MDPKNLILPPSAQPDQLMIHDDEAYAIEMIRLELSARVAGTTVDLDVLRDEIKDRIAQVGLDARVHFLITDQPGLVIPEIEIVARLTPFSKEKMQQEVMDDAYGLHAQRE